MVDTETYFIDRLKPEDLLESLESYKTYPATNPRSAKDTESPYLNQIQTLSSGEVKENGFLLPHMLFLMILETRYG